MVMSAVHALLATMMVGVSTANAIRGSPKPAQKIGGIRHKGRVRDDEIATTTTTTTTLELTSMCRTRKGPGWFADTTDEPPTTEEPSRKRLQTEEPTSPKDAAIAAFNNIMAMEHPFYISGEDTRVNIGYPRECVPQAVIEDVALLTKRYWAPLQEWIRDNKPTE